MVTGIHSSEPCNTLKAQRGVDDVSNMSTDEQAKAKTDIQKVAQNTLESSIVEADARIWV